MSENTWLINFMTAATLPFIHSFSEKIMQIVIVLNWTVWDWKLEASIIENNDKEFCIVCFTIPSIDIK